LKRLYSLLATLGRLPTVSPRQHSRFYLFFHHIVTRPSPFPALTGMPVVDLLRLSALFGLNLLWGWNRNLFNTDFELYGYLTLANGGLALLMGARSNLFAMLARIPSSTLLFYHHWTGRATVIHATIHSALLILSYVQSQQLNVVLQTARIQVGFAAWIALLVILVTSLNLIRRKFFEVFFYPHILFLAFVIGALIHATQAAEFLLPGLALWVIDRLIRLTYNFRAVKITTVSQHAGHLTKFTVTGLRRHAPSQIAWIQIPTISFLNWHPFTIVSVPSSKGEATFAVRGLGGYTKKLHEAVTSDSDATSCPKLQASSSLVMRVDGPYGVGHIPWGYYSVNIIVAGGIGITPGMTIANHIVELAQKAHHVGPDRGWHVHILWVIKTAQFITWFDEELASLAALAADKDVAVTFDLDVHVTGNTALDESSYEDHTPPKLPAHLDPRSCIRDGRPDMPSYFHGLRKLYPGLDAGVSACGPRSLINSVRLSAVTPLSGSKNMGAYHVEEEVFEL
jgi:predicted ferric reductase